MNPDPHNPIPALKALATYGVPKSAAIYLQNNHWVIPENYKDLFCTYYLLRWNKEYFMDTLCEGTIERQGKIYQIIYHRTNPAEIKKYRGHVVLSFRELQHEYDVYPVVLVALAT